MTTTHWSVQMAQPLTDIGPDGLLRGPREGVILDGADALIDHISALLGRQPSIRVVIDGVPGRRLACWDYAPGEEGMQQAADGVEKVNEILFSLGLAEQPIEVWASEFTGGERQHDPDCPTLP